ncbi:hypothetical protein H696_02193 [Fonticula alba]|uniref:Uncharacterized protein n=1 Tax=Fonticula alba TaxID=691883 RepID=A0A058ZBE7_FONAL|nr:hypothetical protein H696_02193 [Fonticula alba]KCV71243.1 hypothetical protein H696_02193 [Fonticula alba]|eukprot:XP_009494366.1 hypothetical protein H696_02193 [Fonticula alba]
MGLRFVSADTPRRPFDFVVILVDWTNLASFNQARLALSGVSSNLAHLSHHRNPEAFDGAAFQLGGLHPETLSSGRACVVCTHVDKRSKSALSAADLSSLTERFLVPVLSANLTSPHSSISTALRISRMAAQASSAAPLPQPAGMTASSAGSLGASGAAPYTRGGSLGLTLEHVLIPRTIHQQPVAMAAPPRQAENPAQPPPAGPESQARR